MIDLLNRFLKKTNSENPLVSESKILYQKFTNFLITKGNNTAILSNLQKSINLDIYEVVDESTMDLLLVKQYLKLEYYLLYQDPAYISSEFSLRNEVRQEFPEIRLKNTFKPLYYKNNQYQILNLAHLLLEFVVETFTKHSDTQTCAKRWQGSLNFEKYVITETSTDVKHLYIKRKIREQFSQFYDELVSSVTLETTIDGLWSIAFKKFMYYYPHLDIKKKLNYFMPDEVSITKEKPSVNPKTAKDETELVKNLDTPIKTQDYYKNTIEYFLESILIINRSGEIIYTNVKAQELLGFSEENLQGNSIFNFLTNEINEVLATDFKNIDPSIPKKIIGSQLESQLTTTNNERIDVEITVSNNYTDNDTFCVTIKNITHSKRVLDVIEEEKKNAERIAQAKTTFLSNMSHEIRTPLNVILGLSAILKNGDIKDEELIRKNLDGIDFSAKNLLYIVNDILDFSKIEAGKLTMQSIDFNLIELLNNFSDGLTIKAKEKGLKLITTIDENVPQIVVGDQYRVNQILANLVGNAIKFTDKGSVKIDVKVLNSKELESDQKLIQFKVSDTGAGISKRDLDRIFNSFYQIEDHSKAKESGTGLGLAITKELIQLQSGKLEVASDLNKGSTFIFTIPFKNSKLRSLNTNSAALEENSKKLEGLHVLVAEDNKMNQFYITQLLSNLKVTADIAENGREAVELYHKSNKDYDLILMDLYMPVMNGLEAIKNIRQLERQRIKKVPIVACSADVLPESKKNAIKVGIDFYLLKPLSMEALKNVLYWLAPDNQIEQTITSSKTSESVDDKSIILSRLMETFDNDTDFVISLLEIFIKETPNDYKSLCTCMDREFYERAGALAHKIKSSFMNLGLTSQGHHLQQIESNLIKREGITDAIKHMNIFKTMYNKTLLDLNLLLIELKSKKMAVVS